MRADTPNSGGKVAEVAVLPQLAERGSDRAAVLVQVDDAGVYVGGPGYRGSVTQVGGNLLDNAGDGALAGGVAPVGALRHGQAYRGQHGRVPGAEVLGRVVGSVMLGLVPLLTPQIVVEVLAAPGRIGAHGLDVTPRIGADPDVLPGRRDHQGLDTGQRPRVLDGRGFGPEVGEPAPAAPAPDPGPVEVAVPQRAAGYGRLPLTTGRRLLPGGPGFKH
jgi:hypothetical protein